MPQQIHSAGCACGMAVNLMFEGEGMSAARARREHLGLTQKDFTMSTRTIDDCIAHTPLTE